MLDASLVPDSAVQAGSSILHAEWKSATHHAHEVSAAYPVFLPWCLTACTHLGLGGSQPTLQVCAKGSNSVIVLQLL
jgi:hypothetical protein